MIADLIIAVLVIATALGTAIVYQIEHPTPETPTSAVEDWGN